MQQSMLLEATPYLSSTLGSPSATRGDDLYTPSESGALARSPDSLGVIQWAALWASYTQHDLSRTTDFGTVALLANVTIPCYRIIRVSGKSSVRPTLGRDE
jgi:hypothetical protein